MRADVRIVGAGPAGRALALGLTCQGAGMRTVDARTGRGKPQSLAELARDAADVVRRDSTVAVAGPAAQGAIREDWRRRHDLRFTGDAA